MAGQTLYDKLWSQHLVKERDDGTALIYIDRHMLHEVTSPQAFEGLRLAGRKPWRLDANLATTDHNVPTTLEERAQGNKGIKDPVSLIQVQTLDDNCDEFGITEFGINDPRQGIVHVVGPEQGATLPGMTVVCGDSHTATHGAFGALAHGIGTSEVERVLAPGGRLIVLGFNPWSLAGLRRLLSRGGWPPQIDQVYSERRLRDWLSLLNFDVTAVQRYFPAFAESEGRLRHRARRLPGYYGGYLLVAVKRVHAVTPLRRLWKRPERVPAGLAEPTTRSRL